MRGGKIKLTKEINNIQIHNYIDSDDNYDFELMDIKITNIYIDEIKLNMTDFTTIKMFGALLNICGFDLNVGNFEFVNACCVEYHVNMFNKNKVQRMDYRTIYERSRYE